MTTIKLAHNAVSAKLIDPPRKVAKMISELLSFMVSGVEHSFAFNTSSWDGRSSFYEMTKHTFPAGFVHMVHHELTRKGYKVLLIRKPHVKPLGPENPIVDEFGNDNPDYDFQMRALRQVEKHGRGIIQVATGGGKSKIAKLIMARYRRISLFITTRGVLLYQMKDQLDEIGLNTGVIGDGLTKMVRGINLGMVQTLIAALKEPDLAEERRAIVKSAHKSKDERWKKLTEKEIAQQAKARFDEKTKRRNRIIKFLSIVEVVIGEEAHEAGGNSYFEILRYCKNATIRVALTATPFMRDAAEDNMRLMAAFGPILIRVTEDMLIKRGILAKPFFKFVDSQPHKKLHRTSPWQRAMTFGYIENEYMHADIVADAVMAKKHRLPVMCLVTRKAHGDRLLEAYEAAGLKARFIRGENDQEERRAGLLALARGEIDVLIGTNILDVGVDVPAVGLVQLAGGGKAEVATRQRIGRGLRSKKGMPNFAFIADYTCNKNSYLSDHYRNRRAIVENTPGFAEGVLPEKTDFPWELFAERLEMAA